MGNPQERSLAWLAGVLEAEGTISVQVYTLPDGRVRLTPFICITNTDKAILDEAFRLFALLAEKSKPRWCKHKGTNIPCNLIRLDGIGCGSVLKALLPYMIGDKTRNAKVVLEFISDRKENLLSRDSLGRVTRKPYTRKQVDLICSIRTYRHAKSSETIRRAPNVI